jgi:hypothetical protein
LQNRSLYVVLFIPSLKTRVPIAFVVGFALFHTACMWSSETSFFSNFSIRQLIERNNSSAGLTCGPTGGGGGIGSFVGINSGGRHYDSHKSDSFACRLTSNEAFDETRFFSALKVDVERALHDAGVQITESGSDSPTRFYFAYAQKNVRGHVQVTGTRMGNNYNVRADLDESGN